MCIISTADRSCGCLTLHCRRVILVIVSQLNIPQPASARWLRPAVLPVLVVRVDGLLVYMRPKENPVVYSNVSSYISLPQNHNQYISKLKPPLAFPRGLFYVPALYWCADLDKKHLLKRKTTIKDGISPPTKESFHQLYSTSSNCLSAEIGFFCPVPASRFYSLLLFYHPLSLSPSPLSHTPVAPRQRPRTLRRSSGLCVCLYVSLCLIA